MRLFGIGLLLLALMLPVLAQIRTTAPQCLPGQYGDMTKVCTLTTNQVTKIKAILQTRQSALHDWDTQNKDTISKLEADLKVARDANDQAKEKDIQNQIRPWEDKRYAIIRKFGREILGVLTPDQQQLWQTHLLQQAVLARFKPARLTDDQIAKITPLCDSAGKAFCRLPIDDMKGQGTLRNGLFTQVQNTILTDAQRATLKSAQQRMDDAPAEGHRVTDDAPAEGRVMDDAPAEGH